MKTRDLRNFHEVKSYFTNVNEVFGTETELKIRNEIERKMQDIQPNVEK
jgi:hypothetical protein